MSKRAASQQGSSPAPPDELSYEQAMTEVEAIADRIESGQAGLEESVAAYERGMMLLKRCRALLEQAEQRVIELSPDPIARTTANAEGGEA